TISHGDTLNSILKNKRGLKAHEVHAWLGKLRPLNPHISDLNRIFPGEKILIPDSYHETVSDAQVWQNAFKGIPRELESPHNGNTQIFWTGAGVTIDSIARRMFAGSCHQNLPLSTKRAILIHNNPDLRQYLAKGRVPANLLVDITPLRLSKFDIHYWQGERSLYRSYLDSMDPLTRQVFQEQGPQDASDLAWLIEELQKAGAAVGLDGLLTSSASGLATAGAANLAKINGLARQMFDDAARQLGRKAATSVKKANLRQLAKFIKSHPNYPELMRQIQKVPRLVLPMSKSKLLPPVAGNVDSRALARYFNKQYFQAFRRWPSGRYMKSIARQLNGRINLFQAAGRHATWYIPAVIGLYSVYDAPPEMRVRTLFEEGFGIVGGWAGTLFGAEIIGIGIVSVLGLGPLGAFVAVFLCATAFGIAGNYVFEKGANAVYDYGSQLDFGQIYKSPEQLLESIK
ncbi:MAG: hypothetical protein PVG41_09745, partial [Desulfobacteraceae bacterium]